MKATILLLCLSATTLCSLSAGEVREFTDTSGRKLKAEVLETGPGWVRVRRDNGQKFLLMHDKLSADDQTWLKEKEAEAAALKLKEAKAAAAQQKAVTVQAAIVKWCKSQKGKQVGNGECWTLADEAFKNCGGKRPGGDLRVWGRKLDFPKEKPQPGDIVEYKNAKFSDGGRTGENHTAVVTGLGKRKGILLISEQNWSGVKKVREVEFDPGALTSGEMMFYRPE